jgi:hypothetical protein
MNSNWLGSQRFGQPGNIIGISKHLKAGTLEVMVFDDLYREFGDL